MNLTAENAKSAEVESCKQIQETINRGLHGLRGNQSSSQLTFRVLGVFRGSLHLPALCVFSLTAVSSFDC